MHACVQCVYACVCVFAECSPVYKLKLQTSIVMSQQLGSEVDRQGKANKSNTCIATNTAVNYNNYQHCSQAHVQYVSTSIVCGTPTTEPAIDVSLPSSPLACEPNYDKVAPTHGG